MVQRGTSGTPGIVINEFPPRQGREKDWETPPLPQLLAHLRRAKVIAFTSGGSALLHPRLISSGPPALKTALDSIFWLNLSTLLT